MYTLGCWMTEISVIQGVRPLFEFRALPLDVIKQCCRWFNKDVLLFVTAILSLRFQQHVEQTKRGIRSELLGHRFSCFIFWPNWKEYNIFLLWRSHSGRYLAFWPHFNLSFGIWCCHSICRLLEYWALENVSKGCNCSTVIQLLKNTQHWRC